MKQGIRVAGIYIDTKGQEDPFCAQRPAWDPRIQSQAPRKHGDPGPKHVECTTQPINYV